MKALDLMTEFKQVGYPVVLTRDKAPAFKGWKERLMDLSELSYWMKRYRLNYGILLGQKLCVSDKDRVGRKEYQWMRRQRIYRSPLVVHTKRGRHAYFRRTDAQELSSVIRVEGMGVDLLTGNRVAVGPGSVVDGFEYKLAGEIVPVEQLPAFPSELLEKPVAVPRMPVSPIVNTNIHSVRRYIRKIVAVSGQGGHNATFRAACKLADAGLSEEEVLAELLTWNETNAEPPWSLKELQHKAHDAVRRTKR